MIRLGVAGHVVTGEFSEGLIDEFGVFGQVLSVGRDRGRGLRLPLAARGRCG